MLTDEELERFETKGYAVVRGAFPRALAAGVVEKAWARLGWDPARPETWTEEVVYMKPTASWVLRELAPRAWEAVTRLVGGADRLADGETHSWSDSFIVNAARREEGKTAAKDGWHVDSWAPGESRHFLDSPEIGLIALALWSDVRPAGGGTLLACGSIREAARLLAEHPEGLPQGRFTTGIRSRGTVVEAAGEAGDVWLLHPLMLHLQPPNPSGRPRFMTRRFVSLKAPLSFSDPARMSPVERAVARALGVERLEFRRKARRRVRTP